MILFPAIDIKAGSCVRLYKGKMDSAEKVADDPLETAINFKNDGAEWVHMVDLDGAVAGKRVNSEVIINVSKNSGLKVEMGGGIRSIQDMEYYYNEGIDRIILGSIAINNPRMVREAIKAFGRERVSVSIDAKNGKVATEGWETHTEMDYIELACRMEGMGVKYIAFTDIDKDGTLEGPNFKKVEAINSAVKCNIIASGGVAGLDDIKRLSKANLYGAICGKSIYTGQLNLKEAIEYCDRGE